MKFLSGELPYAEKLLILFLSLLLAGLCYYQFLYRPVTREIKRCEAQRSAMSTELAQVQQRLSQLKKMQDELDRLGRIGYTSRMPSYNSIEEETTFLNDILTEAQQYTISFSNPTRKDNQVRRNVTLRFTTGDYESARNILTNLMSGNFRCLLGDLRYASAENGTVSVNVSATFFETMVGGSIDSNLKS